MTPPAPAHDPGAAPPSQSVDGNSSEGMRSVQADLHAAGALDAAPALPTPRLEALRVIWRPDQVGLVLGDGSVIGLPPGSARRLAQQIRTAAKRAGRTVL